MGVQSEFLSGTCYVMGLALGIGVVRNPTDCGVTWGTSGRAWSKRGCQGGHQPTPFPHPVLPTSPGPTPHHLLHPIPCALVPPTLKPQGCCPLHLSTVSVFLLLLPGASRQAMSIQGHLLSLYCYCCAPSEQNALWLLLIPPLYPQTLLCPSPELPPHCPPQSLHSHFSPDCPRQGL